MLPHKGVTTSNAFLDGGQRKRTSTKPCNSYPQEKRQKLAINMQLGIWQSCNLKPHKITFFQVFFVLKKIARKRKHSAHYS
jgi:hypothetical protein